MMCLVCSGQVRRVVSGRVVVVLVVLGVLVLLGVGVRGACGWGSRLLGRW